MENKAVVCNACQPFHHYSTHYSTTAPRRRYGTVRPYAGSHSHSHSHSSAARAGGMEMDMEIEMEIELEVELEVELEIELGAGGTNPGGVEGRRIRGCEEHLTTSPDPHMIIAYPVWYSHSANKSMCERGGTGVR